MLLSFAFRKAFVLGSSQCDVASSSGAVCFCAFIWGRFSSPEAYWSIGAGLSIHSWIVAYSQMF
ncbi:hypothetical protein Hdeb2414_s0028g00703241 [Helianthus debilis subsp. tardiflorus]